MALRDFTRERRVIIHKTRRFVVTKPTCETVSLALSRFGGLILACRAAYLESPDTFSDAAGGLVPLFGDGAAEVLSTCCTLHDGAPGEFEELVSADEELRLALVRAICEVSDIARIIELLDLDDIAASLAAPGGQAADAPPGPSAIEIIAAGFAERFHPADGPLSVMQWPYEAVMSLAREVLPALAPLPADDGETIFGRTRAEWAAEGVSIGKTH